jgi:ribokinase
MIALVDEFPERDGEVFVQKFELLPGGSAANVAVLCQRLGLNTAFCGKIGKDHFGKILHSDLKNEKVQVDDFLAYSDKVGTGSCYVCVDQRGDRIIMAHSGAADTLTFDDLPIERIERARWVHLSDLRNVGAIETLLEGDIKINFSISPGALIAQNPSRAYRLAQHAKLIVANVEEMMQIFRCQEEEIDAIAEELICAFEGRIIAVTKGKKGATIYSPNRTFNVPAYNVTPVDTTGAGDCFTAGMLYSLSNGMKPEDAGKFATACAAICIQEVGARSGPKNKREVMKFIRRYD